MTCLGGTVTRFANPGRAYHYELVHGEYPVAVGVDDVEDLIQGVGVHQRRGRAVGGHGAPCSACRRMRRRKKTFGRRSPFCLPQATER